MNESGTGVVTERFDYENVKRIMNVDANQTKQEAKKALDEGTEYLNASVGLSINPENPAVAMAGTAAANIAAKWGNLAVKFDDFVKEIDRRIENANDFYIQNKGFEANAQSTVGGGAQR
jgi:hypothetical protein